MPVYVGFDLEQAQRSAIRCNRSTKLPTENREEPFFLGGESASNQCENEKYRTPELVESPIPTFGCDERSDLGFVRLANARRLQTWARELPLFENRR